MKNIDLTNVQEASDFQKPGAGAYICNITKVQDVPVDPSTGKGDYLKIWYDIAEGEFKGYYGDMRKEHPGWDYVGSYMRSYKEKALGMFKRFCTSVSESNAGYEFGSARNMDESTLVGKKVGLVFREEEYVSNAGEIKTRLQVFKEFPIDKLADQKVPDKKVLDDAQKPAADVGDFVNVPEGVAEALPF